MANPGSSDSSLSSSSLNLAFASLKESLSSLFTSFLANGRPSNENANVSSSEPKVRRPSQHILIRRVQRKPKGVVVKEPGNEGQEATPRHSKYKDFQTIYNDYQDQLNQIQPILNDLMLSIDLNVNCVCSSVVFDVTVLECGHIFCRNCIRTWTTNHKKRCPYCRVLTNADFSSDQIERLMTELDLIQIRHLRFSSGKIENKILNQVSFQENLMSESPNTYTFKCCRVTNYFLLIKYLLSEDHTIGRMGDTLHDRHFPPSLYTRRAEQLKQNRRMEWCWPWMNYSLRQDMILTFTLFLLTYTQMCMFATNRVRLSEWTWTEIFAAGFLYIWSAMCLTYSFMLLR